MKLLSSHFWRKWGQSSFYSPSEPPLPVPLVLSQGFLTACLVSLTSESFTRNNRNYITIEWIFTKPSDHKAFFLHLLLLLSTCEPLRRCWTSYYNHAPSLKIFWLNETDTWFLSQIPMLGGRVSLRHTARHYKENTHTLWVSHFTKTLNR